MAPDLPSMLLRDRTIFLGMPISASVAELVVAQLLLLASESASQVCL
jgi:ATP-dependent protease ClpP protease subunit